MKAHSLWDNVVGLHGLAALNWELCSAYLQDAEDEARIAAEKMEKSGKLAGMLKAELVPVYRPRPNALRREVVREVEEIVERSEANSLNSLFDTKVSELVKNTPTMCQVAPAAEPVIVVVEDKHEIRLAVSGDMLLKLQMATTLAYKMGDIPVLGLDELLNLYANWGMDKQRERWLDLVGYMV